MFLWAIEPQMHRSREQWEHRKWGCTARADVLVLQSLRHTMHVNKLKFRDPAQSLHVWGGCTSHGQRASISRQSHALVVWNLQVI